MTRYHHPSACYGLAFGALLQVIINLAEDQPVAALIWLLCMVSTVVIGIVGQLALEGR